MWVRFATRHFIRRNPSTWQSSLGWEVPGWAAHSCAPADNETCFSPDAPCAVKLKDIIASAKTSLDIATYEIREDQIVDAILLQSKKITVWVIADRRQTKGRYSSAQLLRKAGVSLWFGYQCGIMHDNFMIVNGVPLGPGSFNYAHRRTTANQESRAYLRTPGIVER